MNERYTNPSILRRVLMIAVHVVALFLFWVFSQYFLLSGRCFLYNECSSLDETVGISVSVLCLAGLLLVLYLGITGRLWGARRKPTGG